MLLESRLSYLLQHVSRTFALTIPVLPKKLAGKVAISYLLCRACDTIEDDPDLPVNVKINKMQEFIQVLQCRIDCVSWVNKIISQLHFLNSYEKEVFVDLPSIIETLYSYSVTERNIIIKGVWIMSNGMSFYQRECNIENQSQLDSYCYAVAGVVGELLINLFVQHLNLDSKLSLELNNLSVSFGEGLQLTNILKDIWDDASRGVCWLPLGIKNNNLENVDISKILLDLDNSHKVSFIREKVTISLGHLINAVKFITKLPRRAYGIRRFCFICVSMAFLTLRNIYNNPTFTDPKSIKINRSQVKSVILHSYVKVISNKWMESYFKNLSIGMDITDIDSDKLYNEVSQWNSSEFNDFAKE